MSHGEKGRGYWYYPSNFSVNLSFPKIKTVFNFLKREREKQNTETKTEVPQSRGGRSCLFGSIPYPQLLEKCLAHRRPSISMFNEQRTPPALPAPGLLTGAPETGRERAGWAAPPAPHRKGCTPLPAPQQQLGSKLLPTDTQTNQAMVNKLQTQLVDGS